MNKKAFVRLIKKLAQELPDPDPNITGPVAAPTPITRMPRTEPAAAPTAHPGRGGFVANPQVKRMQEALISLAQAVTEQINLPQMSPESSRQEQVEATSRNSFNNFITKTYMRDSDVPGVEFNPDPTKMQMSEKKPTPANRMSIVMDTMRRIGNPTQKGGEFVADGKWGPRTNAAIHNAYSFAYGLLKMAKDFGITPQSYNEEQLAKFKTLFPEEGEELPLHAKAESAPLVTENVKNIHRLYNEIRQKILEKPEYQTFIEGDTPFATYEKSGAKLTPQQTQAVNAAFANKLQIYNKPISINDLLTADAFKAWVQKNVPQVPVDNALAMLKRNVGTMLRDEKALSERE